jgi:hypothetical protein
MRRCWPAKQCLWLGPGRYLCGGGRRPIAYAHGDGNCNSDANCNDHAECNSYSYGDSNSHTAIWHPNASSSHANSETYSYIEVPADSASATESVRIIG